MTASSPKPNRFGHDVTPDRNSDQVYLLHMLDCIEHIFEYTERSEAHFRANRMVRDAVVRNLQIMAESSQRLSDEVKGIAPNVPWREISGFRNVLAHDYLGLDIDVIWEVIADRLEPLRVELVRLIRASNG